MATYQCSNCGKISDNKKEICNSSDRISTTYSCSSCSSGEGFEGALCTPVEIKPSFYCGQCGSAAAEQDALCSPVKL